MNNNTGQNKVSLEDITETYKGTTEYNAYGKLGKKRREITGILGVDKKANAFFIGSWIAKPFSVLGSAFGFATILASVAHQELFNNIWWFLFALGLGVGIFFEYLSTANEDSLVGFKVDSLTKTGIILIILIKGYAVYMHYQTSDQLAKALTNGVNVSTVADTPRIALLKTQIADLKKDIESKQAIYDKQVDLSANATYAVNKANAQKIVDKLDKKIPLLKEKKEKKENELVTLTGNNITNTKANIKANSEGLIWTFFAMLVIFELGGTLLSVLHAKTILSGVDKTVAVTEEVKTRLYTKKSGLEETTNRLESFRVADDIRANHNAVNLITYESAIKEDEIILREKAKLSKYKVANKELELEVKMAELEELKHDKTIEAINLKIAQIKAIDITPINITTTQTPQVEKPQRKMGFVANGSKDDLIKAILDSADSKGKVIAKSKLINIRDRAECKLYKEAVTELQQEDMLEYKNGYGYFLKEV